MEYVSGNIFIREMSLPKEGDVVQGHEHNFDHTTYVCHGSALIESLNLDGTVKKAVVKSAKDGKNWALVKAGVVHRITALEDNTMAHCIYSHRTPQGDVHQEYTGWPDGTR